MVRKKAIRKVTARSRRKNRGQGITEYGAIIAFVALLASLTFGLTKGGLMPAISTAFSEVVDQLNSLSNTASSGSS